MDASGKRPDNFIVAVRVRPLIPREVTAAFERCVDVDVAHKTVIIKKPDQQTRPSSRIGIEDLGKLLQTDQITVQNFFYDLVLGSSSTQEDVFKCCAYDVVTSVLKGYNGSIIASGQTGSGKTYTIEGGDDDTRGIIPRATELIFSHIQTCASKSDQFLVRTSFVEIYNEKISDLLDPRKESLKIREDGVGGVYVDNLSEHVVRNTAEVMRLLHVGAQLRVTAMTKMNKESSRSHAVFTIIVEHAEHDGAGGSVTTIGKLRLVDLAGSERLDTDAQSKQQEETKNINVSLHTLSKVVTALTTPSVKHVPYRDSKLTRLLQDCLGGNCKTTLVATVTPASLCYTESLNTLKFAKRAKNIKNTAQVNKDMSQKALLSSYQAEIRKLKQQLQERTKDSTPELQQLHRERLEAQKEKDEVKSKLEIQEKIATEAKADKEKLLGRIQQLENMLLHGGDKITDSKEFKQALLKEQERLKRESASEYEVKLAKLELEKQRLEQEKMEVQKQKEYLAELRQSFQSDGGKDERSAEEEAPRSGRRRTSMPPGRALKVASFPQGFGVSRRTNSAESLHYPNQVYGSKYHSWVFPTIDEQDTESTAALLMYAEALAHRQTGIPCQELVSGIRIFTGTAAVQWFMKNMEGVSSVQSAQHVGQRLMDLGVFTEIYGSDDFVVSSAVYYQFCHSNTATMDRTGARRLMATQSLGSFPMRSTPLAANVHQSSTWTVDSRATLSTSEVSLGISGDLLDHFGLTSNNPTEFHIAALYGERAQVKTWITQKNINVTDAVGRTPLMYAVIGKQTKCCLLLIRYGADVNAADSAGSTSLLLAVKYEYEDIVKLLIKNGAQTHFVNADGSTAFHLAAGSQNYKCLEYLCKYGTDLLGINTRDNMYRTPLHVSVLSKLPGHTKRLLMAKADMGVSDRQGRTALHYAVTCNSLPCVQAIVETNPHDINLVDTAGSSALHLACKEGQLEIVSYLSSFQSCDLNLKDQCGCTPLHISVMEKRPNILKILLSRGASVAVKDKKNRTPLHYSIELGYTDCVHVLQTPTD